VKLKLGHPKRDSSPLSFPKTYPSFDPWDHFRDLLFFMVSNSLSGYCPSLSDSMFYSTIDEEGNFFRLQVDSRGDLFSLSLFFGF
jgi:hypothetical protein